MDNYTESSANDAVVGGIESSGKVTLMFCESCGEEIPWAGDYLNGIDYKCPTCGEMTFRGMRYLKT